MNIEQKVLELDKELNLFYINQKLLEAHLGWLTDFVMTITSEALPKDKAEMLKISYINSLQEALSKQIAALSHLTTDHAHLQLLLEGVSNSLYQLSKKHLDL